MNSNHKPGCKCVKCSPRAAGYSGQANENRRKIVSTTNYYIDLRTNQKDLREAIKLQNSRKIAIVQKSRPLVPPTPIKFNEDEF